LQIFFNHLKPWEYEFHVWCWDIRQAEWLHQMVFDIKLKWNGHDKSQQYLTWIVWMNGSILMDLILLKATQLLKTIFIQIKGLYHCKPEWWHAVWSVPIKNYKRSRHDSLFDKNSQFLKARHRRSSMKGEIYETSCIKTLCMLHILIQSYT